MDKERQTQLLEELLSGVKNQDEFEALFDSMRKKGIESLFSAELTQHLGYDKNQKSESRIPNKHIGTSPITVKTKNGEFLIDAPRDRGGSFDRVTLPKHMRINQKLEEVILHR